MNTLKVEIAHLPKIYSPKFPSMVVRAELGTVVLFVGDKRVEITTIVAVDIGLTIAKSIPKLAPTELIVLIINGERIELLPIVAKKVSTALLAKAVKADDWQTQHRGKVI
jgi:hypothetical protein